MQSNLCVHTKYENMDKIYLYPIWEFLRIVLKRKNPHLVGTKISDIAVILSLYDEHEINIAKDNCKTVIETLGGDPHFAVIVKVECINKKIGIPQIRKEELISRYE